MNMIFKNTTFLTSQIFLYSRVSTEQQVDGHGLKRQTDNNDRDAKALAAKYNLTIAAPISDEGKSAFKGHNLKDDAGLGQFLKDIDAGHIAPGSWLVVDEFSRLTRLGHRKLLGIMTQLLDGGVNVMVNGREFLHDEDGMEDAINLIIAILQGAKDHDASREKAKSVAAAKAKHREDVIIGSRSTTNKRGIVEWCKVANETPGKPGTGEVVLIPERAAIIRRIFDLYIGGYGYNSIATQLNDAKVPPFRKGLKGKPGTWHSTYITKTIVNRAVLGEQRLKDGSVAMVYPPVIDQATFDQAQQVRLAKRENFTGGRRTDDIPNLFTGLLHCQHCQSSMLLQNKGRKSPTRMQERQIVCSNAHRHAGCIHDTKWWFADFEQRVLTAIHGHLSAADIDQPVTQDDGTAALQSQLDQAIEDRDFWSDEYDANRKDTNARDKYRTAVAAVEDLTVKIAAQRSATQSVNAIAQSFWQSSNAMSNDTINTLPRPLLAQHIKNIIQDIQVDVSAKDATIIWRDGTTSTLSDAKWLGDD